jgi:hypothetical protein
MTNNILRLVGLLIGIVLVGALVFLLYTFFASRASQTDNQTQQAGPLTSTPVAVAGVADPFSTSVFDAPPSSWTYLFSPEVDEIAGRIVAQGENPNPDVAPNNRLESYRLAELNLPKSIPVTIDGTTTQVSVIWRLTVTGGPFKFGANDWMIWLDDALLGRAGLQNNLSEISVLIVDRSLLRNGSMIFVAYGRNRPIPVTKLELIDESQ